MHSIFVSLLLAAIANAKCFERSPAFLPPPYVSDDPVLHQAFSRIESRLASIVAASEYNTSSFSVEVTSSSESLWSSHHTARDRNASVHDVDTVDGDTLYRIASITKTFTVLGLLYQHAAGNLSLDDSIDTYIEELRGKQKGTIPWKDITLRTLASQLSGIPREIAQSDLYYGLPNATQYGLPPVSPDGLLECDEYTDYEIPCQRKDLVAAVKSQTPLFAPKQKSTYSNVNYELLGLALENVTGQSYESYLEDAIFRPLSMKRTTLSRPPDNYGVIPKGRHYWGIEEGVQNPTGGIYSSSNDMSKYLRYILTHYNGVTSSLNWLHPASWGDSLQSFYGTPWEIFRTNNILTQSARPVTFVTKSGGLPGYFSTIFVMPEYELGITILVAGSIPLLTELREVVTVELVNAAEDLVMEHLDYRYSGQYVSSDSSLNSSIRLSVDHNKLVLDQLISNSTDVLASGLPQLAGAPENEPWIIQLVPTLLYKDQEAQKGELWRLLVTNVRDPKSQMIWDEFCITDVDLPAYGGIPINEVVIWRDDDGVVEEIELSGFRVKLKPQSTMLKESQQDQAAFVNSELR